MNELLGELMVAMFHLKLVRTTDQPRRLFSVTVLNGRNI